MPLCIFLTHGTARLRHLVLGGADGLAPQEAWMEPLSQHFRNSLGAEVTTHYWSGAIRGPWQEDQIARCARSLGEFLKNASDRSDCIAIVAKSNGAQLVENAFCRLSATALVVPAAVEIRLATPLRGSAAHAARFDRRYRLSSRTDSLYALARPALRLLFAASDYKDESLREVQLYGCSHHDFNQDAPLESTLDGSATTLYALCSVILLRTRDCDDWLTAGFRKGR